MDRLAQIAKQEQRQERYEALPLEKQQLHHRLNEEEAFLIDTIKRLDECAVMLATADPKASALVKQGNDLLRRALCEVADEVHDMLCE